MKWQFPIQFNNDHEFLYFKIYAINTIAGTIALTLSLFGDFIIKMFEPRHPIEIGVYQLGMALLIVVMAGLNILAVKHHSIYYSGRGV